MKRTDIMVLIVIWEFFSASLAFIVIASLSALGFPAAIDLSDTARVAALFGLSVATAVFLAYFGISMAAGIGMLSGKEWGRTSAIVHATLSMASVPFGTVLGILTLIYLTRPKIKEYFGAERHQALSSP
ncbi:MAG: hypothetical protein V3S51_06745 [Dehalococcoidia bacterium]